MNKEKIEKLKSKLVDFQNKDVYVELQQSIQYHVMICNCKIIVSNQKLIISDEQQQDLIIELHYLEDIKIEDSAIYMEMSNDVTIILDC